MKPQFMLMILLLSSISLHAQDDMPITNEKILEEMTDYLKHLNGEMDSESKRAEQMKTVIKVNGLWKSAEFRRLRDLPLVAVVNQEQKSPFFVSAVAFHDEEIEDYSDSEPVHDISPELCQNFIDRARKFRKSLKGFSPFTKVGTVVDTRRAIQMALNDPHKRLDQINILAIDPNLRFAIINYAFTLTKEERYKGTTSYYAVPINESKTLKPNSFMEEEFLNEDESYGTPSVAFGPDGNLMAILNKNNFLDIFDTREWTPKLLYTFRDDQFKGSSTRIVVSDDNENIVLLYDTEAEKKISIFNIASQKIIFSEKLPLVYEKTGSRDVLFRFLINSAELNPSKLELAQTTENGIQFTDITPTLKPNPSHMMISSREVEKTPLALSFRNDGKMMAIHNYTHAFQNDHYITIHELPSFTKITEIPVPNLSLGRPWTFHPLEPLIYIMPEPGMLIAYHIYTGDKVFTQNIQPHKALTSFFEHTIYFDQSGKKLIIHDGSLNGDALVLWQASEPDLRDIFLIDPDKISPEKISPTSVAPVKGKQK